MDINVPPTHFHRQAHVLAFAPDGEGYLVLGHSDGGPLAGFAFLEDDLQNLGGPKAIDNQDFGGLAPRDDVNFLAVQFVNDASDARAAHAHTGADTVHTRVEAAHGDFRAQAGLPDDLDNFDHAFLDLRHFKFKEPPQEIRVRARKRNVDLLRQLLDVEHNSAYAIPRLVMLAGHLFGAGDNALRFLHLDDDIAVLEPLHRAAHQHALLGYEFLVDALAFGLPDLLDNHLLCRLGGDPAEHLRVYAFISSDGRDLAAFAVYFYGDVLVGAVVLPCSQLQCALNCLKDNLFVDVLVLVQAIDKS